MDATLIGIIVSKALVITVLVMVILFLMVNNDKEN